MRWLFRMLGDLVGLVPIYVKQTGRFPVDDAGDLWPEGTRRRRGHPEHVHLRSFKGETPEEWPTPYRIREFPA
jgi:hypothetical protein